VNPKAVISDLDGTLLDTIDDLADSMNAVLRRFGQPEHPVAAYNTFVGDGVRMLIRRAFPEGFLDDDRLREAGAAMREEYLTRFDSKTRPYPGIEEMLTGLFDRKLPVAILSNKQHDFTKLTVARLLPGFPFAAVVGAKPDVPKKPDPQAALEIARQLEVAPEEVIYIGDTNTDMETAVSAGFVPVGVLWGFRGEEELRASGARELLAVPTDLLRFFDL
jgi:phosphoglycolate phosphatase